MRVQLDRFYSFIRAFNFCFGLMLFIFAASIFLTIYMNNLWYLLLAGFTFTFFWAFYMVFNMLLDFYTLAEDVQDLENKVDDLNEFCDRALENIYYKEQNEIDFNAVNKNNKF